MELSPTQVKSISLDIKKRGVHLPALQEDLLDHICCLVEEEMANTGDFKKAYFIVLKKFGSLQSIELETQKSVEETKRITIFYKCLDYLMTFAFILIALLFFAGPVLLTFIHGTFSFVLAFSPFMVVGAYIFLTRINYKRFEIITFKQQIFPGSLIH